VSYDDARAALAAWKAAFPVDPYESDVQLRSILARSLESARLRALEVRASAFARELVAVVAPAAQRYEQHQHLPELIRYDPAYHETGAVVWSSGVVAFSKEPGSAYEQATLLYLLSLEGEAGHACPATCTIGLARALRRSAAPAVRDRFLPALVDPHYSSAARGAQFLTEVQGGSDVGANECVAVANDDGQTYLISGEKWFCSVANADQFFITARVPGGPSGTRGLGSFVVPRMIDGRPNGFSIRRLKDKLGTRALASGEIDFDGALAWPIGPIEEGFRTAVSVVLNTSRWMTAIGSAGIMRRAVLEARSFARFREAFGVPIERFAPLRRTLADMTATTAGALHLVFALTELEDRIDDMAASEDDVLYHRFLVNAAKYLVSRQATSAVRSGIEVLGGNGTIEDFSVLPRLYRDAIVYDRRRPTAARSPGRGTRQRAPMPGRSRVRVLALSQRPRPDRPARRGDLPVRRRRAPGGGARAAHVRDAGLRQRGGRGAHRAGERTGGHALGRRRDAPTATSWCHGSLR
jgi:acyl-CoA dehydrogenase